MKISLICFTCTARDGFDNGSTSLMNIRFYPNPVNDILNIAYNSLSNGDVSIRLFDATGRLVLFEQQASTEGDNQITLNLAGRLPVGLYIVEVQQADQTEKARIIVE